jgi:predicted alpha/beta superfamily hydrolase
MKISVNNSRLARKGIWFLFFLAVISICGDAAVLDSSISTIKIQSAILNEERVLSVALPAGYQDGKDPYLVLYILDAEAQPSFLKDCSLVEQLISEGVMPPMIVIGIWNAEGTRNRDMIPEAVSHRPGSGGSKRFLQFIETELMGLVKKEYRTSDMSILYGGSNAGLFSVYAMLEESELFDACIAGSPMIGHCPDYMQDLAADFVTRSSHKNMILYMIYGSEDSPRVTDFAPDYQTFLEKNATTGFKSYHIILQGEGHVPPSSLEQGLRTIFIN